MAAEAAAAEEVVVPPTGAEQAPVAVCPRAKGVLVAEGAPSQSNCWPGVRNG